MKNFIFFIFLSPLLSQTITIEPLSPVVEMGKTITFKSNAKSPFWFLSRYYGGMVIGNDGIFHPPSVGSGPVPFVVDVYVFDRMAGFTNAHTTLTVVASSSCGTCIDGKPGLDGKPGINGINGLNGKDGLPGLPGKDGKDGITGILFSPDNLGFGLMMVGQRLAVDGTIVAWQWAPNEPILPGMCQVFAQVVQNGYLYVCDTDKSWIRFKGEKTW